MKTDTPRTDAQATGNSDPQQDEYEDLLYFTRTLERELNSARAELAEMTARAASLAAYLPPDTLCGDIQKWRDEYKMAIDQRDRLAEALKEYREALSDGPENCSYKMYEAVDEFAEKALAAMKGDKV